VCFNIKYILLETSNSFICNTPLLFVHKSRYYKTMIFLLQGRGNVRIAG